MVDRTQIKRCSGVPRGVESTQGFTLLEVILAVAVTGALLAGAATFMVSVTNAWLERENRHFFEDHVDGVAEFVQACFVSAGSEVSLADSGNPNSEGSEDPQEGNDPSGDVSLEIEQPGGTNENSQNNNESDNSEGGGLLRTTEEPIAWGKPPGAPDYEDPRISFSLRDTPPLLVQKDDAPVIGVTAFLHFEADEGLSLLWYTPLQEEAEDIDDLKRTPLSDLVTKVEYTYWDEDSEKWEIEDEPREGEDEEFILPRFLKLTFEYEGQEKYRTITIPVTSRAALIF